MVFHTRVLSLEMEGNLPLDRKRIKPSISIHQVYSTLWVKHIVIIYTIIVVMNNI